MIYGIIAILVPSVLGVKFFDYLNRGLSLKNTIYYYLILVLFSNILTVCLSYLVMNIGDNVFYNIWYYPIIFVKYTAISVVLNVCLVLFITVLKKNISFEVISGEKKKKTNKK